MTSTNCNKCGRPMVYTKENKCNYCDTCMSEYCGCKLGRIKEMEPTCDSTAVIPSVTVQSVEGITNLANCLVHVEDINTTFYVDDKHRVMITWAGPVDIPGYDMANNPNGYRDQIVTDIENETAVIYDKHGNGFLFGITKDNLQTAIDNKLDEMAADGTLETIIASYMTDVAHVFDTVTDMKLATDLVSGTYAQTLGFHSINDGGGALYYITDTGTANEMDVIAIGSTLYANLIIDTNHLNVKQFGAYGDNTHDDLAVIQGCIDYGFATNNNKIYLPKGNYIVSNAINLYEQMQISGNIKNNTQVIKNTNSIDSDSNVDAILILKKSAESAISYTQAQHVNNLWFIGNRTNTYGIYCETPSPRIEIADVAVQRTITGIKLNSGWLYAIKDVSINPVENGIDISHTSTTLNMENVYVYGGTGTGYHLKAIGYSNLTNLACDGNTGTPYHFEWSNLSIDGLGCECQGANKAIFMNQSKIDINNATIIVNPTSADYVCFDVGSSEAVINKANIHDYGENNIETPGKFLNCRDHGDIKFIACSADKKFATANSYAEPHDAQKISDRRGEYITLGNANSSGLGTLDSRQDDFIAKTNQDFYMGAIIFNNRGAARYGLDGFDKRWKPAHELGDIFVNQAPALNGIAMFQQTSDYSDRDMAGTITATSISGDSGTITLTTLDLSDFSKNRGLVVETNHNITSSSGGSANISGIDTLTNTLTLSSISGDFQVGDTLVYKGRTLIGNSTYSNIQSIGYGTTAQRPSTPVNGYMYWDTTLGKPIWRVGGNWKDATGTNV